MYSNSLKNPPPRAVPVRRPVAAPIQGGVPLLHPVVAPIKAGPVAVGVPFIPSSQVLAPKKELAGIVVMEEMSPCLTVLM